MPRKVFLGSVTLAVLFYVFSQIPDPGIFGIDEEPERIMFYGGFGILAGLFGIISFGSGTYLFVTWFADVSKGQRYFILAIMLMVLVAVAVGIVVRFYLV